MNKKQIAAEMLKLANMLDSRGFTRQAQTVDGLAEDMLKDSELDPLLDNLAETERGVDTEKMERMLERSKEGEIFDEDFGHFETDVEEDKSERIQYR